MEVTAKLRHLQQSPQKVRLVADLIRGKSAEDAAVILKHTEKRAARSLAKLLKSAVANAENRDDTIDIDDLYVKEIFVDQGPALKRVWFTTMGRAFRKLKRQSHVTIKLDTRGESGAEES
ncbi:MAG: 50S ribosomal protein L22 [Acidobacteriota bacterium]